MKHHGEKRRVGFSHHTAPAATAAKRDNCAISSPLPSLRDTFPRKQRKGNRGNDQAMQLLHPMI